LLLPEGQIVEAWEPSERQCCLGNRGAWDRKIVSFCVVFKGLMTTGKKEYVVSNHDEWKHKRNT
jgi:hypothetical protein